MNKRTRCSLSLSMVTLWNTNKYWCERIQTQSRVERKKCVFDQQHNNRIRAEAGNMVWRWGEWQRCVIIVRDIPVLCGVGGDVVVVCVSLLVSLSCSLANEYTNKEVRAVAFLSVSLFIIVNKIVVAIVHSTSTTNARRCCCSVQCWVLSEWHNFSDFYQFVYVYCVSALWLW